MSEQIEIAGRTYQMTPGAANVLRGMMRDATESRCEEKARAAVWFVVVAEGLKQARRVA